MTCFTKNSFMQTVKEAFVILLSLYYPYLCRSRTKRKLTEIFIVDFYFNTTFCTVWEKLLRDNSSSSQDIRFWSHQTICIRSAVGIIHLVSSQNFLGVRNIIFSENLANLLNEWWPCACSLMRSKFKILARIWSISTLTFPTPWILESCIKIKINWNF